MGGGAWGRAGGSDVIAELAKCFHRTHVHAAGLGRNYSAARLSRSAEVSEGQKIKLRLSLLLRQQARGRLGSSCHPVRGAAGKEEALHSWVVVGLQVKEKM